MVNWGAKRGKAEFKFDDLMTDTPTVAPIALRYHYDAQGRVVGRTLSPGTQDEETQYFIYDNDRIVQELRIDENGAAVLAAEWVYGSYIDEILAMYRDTDRLTTAVLFVPSITKLSLFGQSIASRGDFRQSLYLPSIHGQAVRY